MNFKNKKAWVNPNLVNFVCKNAVDNFFRNFRIWKSIYEVSNDKNIPLWIWKFELNPIFSGSDIVSLVKWAIDSLVKQYQQIFDKKFELLKYYFTITLSLVAATISLYKLGFIWKFIFNCMLVFSLLLIIVSISYWWFYIWYASNVLEKLLGNISKTFLTNLNGKKDYKDINIKNISDPFVLTIMNMSEFINDVINEEVIKKINKYVLLSNIIITWVTILFSLIVIFLILWVLF